MKKHLKKKPKDLKLTSKSENKYKRNCFLTLLNTTSESNTKEKATKTTAKATMTTMMTTKTVKRKKSQRKREKPQLLRPIRKAVKTQKTRRKARKSAKLNDYYLTAFHLTLISYNHNFYICEYFNAFCLVPSFLEHISQCYQPSLLTQQLHWQR